MKDLYRGYKCNVCKDTGYIVIQQERSQPLMKQCKCLKEERARRQWINSGIDPNNNDQTFGSFIVNNDISKRCKEIAIKYYKEFSTIRDERRNSILLCGQSGSGKTHLTIALGKNLISKGTDVVYMPYRDIITNLKQNMLDNEVYKKQLSKYKKCEVLLIDDLFKGKINESDINIMFEIINYRYMNHKPIIVSSEFTLGKMLNFDEAVGSRIYEMCKDYVVQIEGKEFNYRLRGN